MKTLLVLDSSGDRAMTWDDSAASTSARLEAQALFERMLRVGGAAFKLSPEDGIVKVTDFGQLEAETVIVPRVVGG